MNKKQSKKGHEIFAYDVPPGGCYCWARNESSSLFFKLFFFSIFYTYENYFEKLNLKIHSMLTLYSGMTLSL